MFADTLSVLSFVMPRGRQLIGTAQSGQAAARHSFKVKLAVKLTSVDMPGNDLWTGAEALSEGVT